ncbi:uncharacterized protein [Oryza sativa Japonica Group]|uniref:Os05g0464200 protein n=4 Tax=Oryza TaxID=4527 RepID=A0A5S6RAJ9_ORYSJ|nr:uncharacterized protein LOC4339039 [Oryza sativa Japonica Group]KAB8099791.1 hypothetical protein EE612_030034 [Oryza sativa]AAT58774.1 hypothetical protein [Oryza sativa Japonica Group]AAU90182.1 unknown protein [Oryza sativa Japonica Group]KAF2931174.1 hypothetical protein DAI22_05g190250 [Oryza sativa Japonica Group]BAF17692.2 Os05g0464200 [Oryza sativa Japonica Group]|eukprot:NP_001055778.2 Os05g0464200 [Oryza sativa Japonica Group]
MATESYPAQAPAPAMPPAAGDRAGGGGGGRAARAALLPPPRRGQIKEQIIKDIVAAFSGVIAGRGRNDRNGGGGVPVSDDTDN